MKKSSYGKLPPGNGKQLLKMKTVLLLWACLFSGVLMASGQLKRITVKVRNATFQEFLQVVKKESGLRIIYQDELLGSVNKRITLNLVNTPVDEVMDKVLFDTRLTCSVVNDQLVLVQRPVLKAKPVTAALVEDSVYRIRGRVYTGQEPPQILADATISVKSTGYTVVSDADGYFEISARKNEILVFSMVGYVTKEQVLNKDYKNLVVSLLQNQKGLDEVVVVGHNQRQRKHIASSIASLDVQSRMEGKTITSLSQSLQGGVTGLQVQQSSGMPGGDAASIKIRGITTMMNSNDPLILVDGVPMPMEHLNPATIESVTILKDAAAAASYGARAANGVVLITTKRGKAGKVSVAYDGYYGFQSPSFLPEFVDAATYMEMYNMALVNSGSQATYSQQTIDKTREGKDPILYPNTDWVKETIKTLSPVTSHSVSVNGGNDVARFAITADYLFQDGMIPVNKMDRLNLRANTTISLSKKLTVNLDVVATRRKTLYPNRDIANGGSRMLDDMYRLPPTVLPKYPSVDGLPEIYGRYSDIVNPTAYAEKGGSISYEFAQSLINLQPKWRVTPDLNVQAQMSYRLNSDVYTQKRDNYYFYDYFTRELVQTWAVQRDAYSQTRDVYYFLLGQADYTKRFGDHEILALAGYSQEEFQNGYWNRSSLMSAYAKLNYTYKDKFLMEASIRTDGSSKFGPGNKFGTFPSLALGWNIHREDFMENVSMINNLKLRASYGKLGNENIGLYRYQSLINPTTGLEAALGNKEIQWEEVGMLDIGFDLGILNDKLTFTFDYYDKRTNKMLIEPQVSLVGGTSNITLNNGKVKNTGWEASMSYNTKLAKSLGLIVRPGISYNDNEITSLPGGRFFKGTAALVNQVGGPIDAYYGYLTDGLLQYGDFESDKTTAKVPVRNGSAPGDIRYIDFNKDGEIDEKDQTMIGNGVPKYNYFANIEFDWNNFNLEFLLQGVGKVDLSNNRFGNAIGYVINPIDLTASGGIPTTYYAANAWRPNNMDARYPRINATPTVNTPNSDFWLQNGAYLRMKFIQLSYALKGNWMKKAGIQYARVYVNTQNPFVISNVKLVDPESQGGSRTYGIMKSYTIGCRITL